MRKTLIILSSLALTSLGLVGCDQQSANNAAAQLHLDSAIAQIEDANSGFKSTEDTSVSQFRVQELQKALADLNKVQELGSKHQKVSASLLKADIELASARNDLNDAKKLYSEVAPKAATLLSYIYAVDNAESTVLDLDANIDKSAFVKAAKDENKIQKQRIDQLSVQVKELDAKLATINQKKEAYLQQAQNFFANSRELKSKAFKASGDTRYKLLAQASAEERKSNMASCEADKLDAAAARYEVAIKLNAKETDAANTVINTLAARSQEALKESEANKQNKLVAIQERDDLYEKFREEFNAVTKSFKQDVLGAYAKSANTTQKAISTLNKAKNFAAGFESQQIRRYQPHDCNDRQSSRSHRRNRCNFQLLRLHQRHH